MDIVEHKKNVIESKFDENTNTLYIDFLNKNINIVVNGNLSFCFDGELSCVTKNNNIWLDSINGGIYLNSRWNEKNIEHENKDKNEFQLRLEILEKEIRILKDVIQRNS
jgi:hypothetical protein